MDQWLAWVRWRKGINNMKEIWGVMKRFTILMAAVVTESIHVLKFTELHSKPSQYFHVSIYKIKFVIKIK